jgi:hypothetical protein
MACRREADMSDEQPEEGMFAKIVRWTFMFLGALALGVFLIFGVCTLMFISGS